MGLNFIIFMQMDASLLIAGALLLGVPMAVLVPPFCFPSRIGGMVNLSRVLLCYILVGVLGAVLPFLFVVSGVFHDPCHLLAYTVFEPGDLYLPDVREYRAVGDSISDL
jgi:hypothetical protein